MAMDRLTAALIVRDESRFIAGCLESLVSQVDEIVLVDTGSRDDTVEKALRFPVAFYRFDWCDDFSAARNFALQQATGEWILYIDADERFEVPRPQILRNALADDRKVAWTLRFHPRVDWTPYAELRLFRNDPRIRFCGTIHERVHESIEAIVRASGMEIGHCDLAIQHVGYEDDQSWKNARNIPLLRDRLRGDPDHLYSWWHLGQCLSLAGNDEGAMAAWSNGMAAARKLAPPTRCNSQAQSAVSLIKLQIAHGIDVAALLREAIELYPDHLALRWIDATSALERGDNKAARPLLEMLAAIDPDKFFDQHVAYDKAIFRYLAKEALALYHFREERFSEAAHYYRLAAQYSPDRAACETKARLAELRMGP
jgi:glycosyltransferase involved in cell wall biosynthesis